MPKKQKLFFYLAPVAGGEVGVFSSQLIRQGTYLPLFARGDYHLYRHSTIDNMPGGERFARYCVKDSRGYHGPADFNCMSVGWYVEHSESPTARHRGDYEHYYALRDIQPGDQITFDHRTLDDPRYP